MEAPEGYFLASGGGLAHYVKAEGDTRSICGKEGLTYVGKTDESGRQCPGCRRAMREERRGTGGQETQ